LAIPGVFSVDHPAPAFFGHIAAVTENGTKDKTT
jgi:hypothetical protein